MGCLSSHSCVVQPSLTTGSFILQYHRQRCLGRDEDLDVFLPFCFGMVCSVYAMESSFLCERWDIEGRRPTSKTVIHQAIFGCVPTVYHSRTWTACRLLRGDLGIIRRTGDPGQVLLWDQQVGTTLGGDARVIRRGTVGVQPWYKGHCWVSSVYHVTCHGHHVRRISYPMTWDVFCSAVSVFTPISSQTWVWASFYLNIFFL